MGLTLVRSTQMTSRNGNFLPLGHPERAERVEGSHNKIITRAVAATAKTPLDIEKKKD